MTYRTLRTDRKSPPDGSTKKDILATNESTIGFVSLDEEYEIEPHPEPYAVFSFVLEGGREFTTSEGTVELTDGDTLYLKPGERRGIQCKRPLTILSVQESH